MRRCLKTILKATTFICAGSFAVRAFGQAYIHPNQAGHAGGNTTSAGTGSQVVLSTYLGAATDPVTGIQGTIFVSDKSGGNKFAVADFAGYPGDGSFPFYTTPQQMSDGNLYGTSFIGGSFNLGTVYKYDLASGTGSCGKTVVHNNSVGDPASGLGNYANVNELSDGKLYVAYSYGGNPNGWGQIIRMNKNGSGVEVLKNFAWLSATVPYTTAAQLNANDGVTPVSAGTRYDGAHPYGFVTEGADGKIYGTCVRGGTFDHGVVWRMNKDGSSYEVIHACDSRFLTTRVDGFGVPIVSGAHGMLFPWGNVAQDQLGRIYLNGYNGGQNNQGGLSRMNADGSNVQILMSGSAANGTFSYRGPLIIDNEVFGTFRTNGGGTSVGVLWKYDLLTGQYTKLKTFENTGGYQDGYDIWAGVAFDGGHLFGTAIAGGGAGNVGTLWKIKRDGTDFQVLHRFSQSAGGTCGEGRASLFSYFPSAERVTFADVSQNCSRTCIADATPLPLIFKKFEVSKKEVKALLEWETTSELNVRGFEVERSAEGTNWDRVAYVSSKSDDGDPYEERYYTLSDEDPLPGKNMYRLKQVDFDGQYTYSVVRSLSFPEARKISVYPNPARDKVDISGLEPGDRILVHDVLGRSLLSSKAVAPHTGISLAQFPAGALNILIISKNGITTSVRVLKEK